VTALEHAGQHGNRTVKRTADVDLHSPPPVVRVSRRDRADRARDSGVVNEKVDEPHLSLDLGDHALDVLTIRNINPDGQGVPAARRDLRYRTGDFIFGARADGHGSTGIAQGQGDGSANSATGSRDQCHLPAEIEGCIAMLLRA
jgi:hypothetical protein